MPTPYRFLVTDTAENVRTLSHPAVPLSTIINAQKKRSQARKVMFAQWYTQFFLAEFQTCGSSTPEQWLKGGMVAQETPRVW